MNEQTMRFRVGIFVLAALILLAVLIILFGGVPTFFKLHNRYTAVFPEAPDVGPGTPVRRSGVRIGEVRSVQLDNETGKVRVELMIERKYILHSSDQVVLVQGLLGGDTSINFVPRPPNGEVAEPGTEFKGFRPTTAQGLINQTSELVPNAQDAFKEINKLVPELRRTNDEIQVASRNWGKLGERLDVLVHTNRDKLEKAVDNLNDTLVRISNVFNEDNQRNLNAILKNTRAGSENLENITKNTNELIKESQQTIKKVNDSVRQADEVLVNLQKATKPMADRSANVMKNLEESTDKLNKVLAEVQELLQCFTKGDGSLRAFLTDPGLYKNLNDAAWMLTRILPRVDRALQDVEVFTDKIARHPEALGLGGVVTPGSGLKK